MAKGEYESEEEAQERIREVLQPSNPDMEFRAWKGAMGKWYIRDWIKEKGE